MQHCLRNNLTRSDLSLVIISTITGFKQNVILRYNRGNENDEAGGKFDCLKFEVMLSVCYSVGLFVC